MPSWIFLEWFGMEWKEVAEFNGNWNKNMNTREWELTSGNRIKWPGISADVLPHTLLAIAISDCHLIPFPIYSALKSK